MKKAIIGILLMVSMSAWGQATREVQAALEQMVTHAEEASLYRQTVDWDTLRPNIYKLAKGAESIADLSPALRYMLKSLGDEHGRVFHNGQIIANYYSGTPKEHLKTFQPDIYNQIQMGQVYDFHAEMLEEDIGYVSIVGLPMGDNEKMAADIQQEVCRLVDKGAKKWVIDLRYNGGGNMHPMAEGLALIIGDGKVGGAKGLTESEHATWKVENSHFYYDDYSIELKDDCKLKGIPEVAVLTSLYTASSGEAIAVIFKGREHTRFFGQKTLGMITVTDWHIINDATAMTISVSYYQDRNEVVYKEYVEVDLELPFTEEPLSDDDKCLNAAVEWLTKNKN